MTTSLNILPISPSSPFNERDVESGIALLKSKGMNVLDPAQRRDFSLTYLNGSDEQRLLELNRAIHHPTCDLMWVSRGGYGISRLLPRLDLPPKSLPKVVGFSDTTALLCHMWRHRKAKGIHAPNLTRLSLENAESLSVLWAILEGKASQVNWPHLNKLWWPATKDSIQGPLIVSNLCVLTHLVGTPSMPSLEGCILAVEEIGERPYRIDRMLTHLWSSGALRGVKAIVLGQFTSCEEMEQPELTPQSVILERCRYFGIPLCEGLPIGHETPNWAVPFGVQAKLDDSKDGVELHVLEEIF